VLSILAAAPTPEALGEMGVEGMAALVSPLTSKAFRELPENIMAALGEQTVRVPGSVEFGRVIASLARRLLDVVRERRAVTAALKEKLANHPVAQIMASMPGIATNSSARLLIAIGDGSRFRTADHLAAYAGLAPVTRQSGSSIHGQRQARRGNRTVKNVFYFATRTAAITDPASRAYYQRKRAEGKRHNAALIALARRKVTVLHAMLRTRTPYRCHEQLKQVDHTPSRSADRCG
jgi:transposase